MYPQPVASRGEVVRAPFLLGGKSWWEEDLVAAGGCARLDALKIVMKSGGAETTFSGAGSIIVGGSSRTMKHVEVKAGGLNSLADGDYKVLFRDLRDEIGNFSDEDGDPSTGIQEIKFDLPLW